MHISPLRPGATCGLAAFVAAAGIIALATPAALEGQRAELSVPDAYAITNARIVPVSGAAIARGTVVIRNGVFAAVGAGVPVPADARAIDGAGLTIYPGFIDAYSHVGIPAPRQPGGGGGAGITQVAQQSGGGSAPPSAPNSLHPPGLQPELRAADLLRVDGDGFSASHAAGFTTALAVPRDGIFMGQSALIDLTGGDAQQTLVRSPVAMHIGFTPLRAGGYPNSLLGVFSALRQMLLDAGSYRDAQAAYARNPRGMRRPEQDQSLAALQPVLAREMPVVMLAGTKREIERALDLAREFNLRLIIAGGNEAWMVADRLKAANVPVIATLNFPQRSGPASPDADPEPLRLLRERVDAPKNAARLATAGVRFSFTSGGMSNLAELLPNLARAVEGGLSADQAVRALTLQAAEMLGVADRLGSIEVGKIANLTMVRGELGDRSARVAQLFIDGRPVEVRVPASAAGSSVMAATGTWTLNVTTDAGEKSVTLSLQQEGDRLRGQIQGALGTRDIGGGSIGANGDIRFTVPLTFAEETNEATFTGTVAGNAMRGTVTIVGHAAGTFIGTRPGAAGTDESGRSRRPPD